MPSILFALISRLDELFSAVPSLFPSFLPANFPDSRHDRRGSSGENLRARRDTRTIRTTRCTTTHVTLSPRAAIPVVHPYLLSSRCPPDANTTFLVALGYPVIRTLQ